MNCMHVIAASSAKVTHCPSVCGGDLVESDDDQCSNRLMGPSLIAAAAAKVDQCLARLQNLQGTVTCSTAPVSAPVSVCLSPNFSRARNCLHGSPRVHEDDKVRIHDVLRWSDDVSAKSNRERRGGHKRRPSHSKTEVFDDKKDPLDPHGEWKHWSSPAGDVHKVISEILMASQIAKQITSMVNAALFPTDLSNLHGGSKSSIQKTTKEMAASADVRSLSAPRTSKETAEGDRQLTDTNTSCSTQSHQRAHKRDDPLHRFRVVSAADVTLKRRSSSGMRKEVLYPTSKQIPDRPRHANDNEGLSSTAKKIASRKSSKAKEQSIVREITNRKAPHSQGTKKDANENLPATVKRARNSRSPPRACMDVPKTGTPFTVLQPCVTARQRSGLRRKPSATLVMANATSATSLHSKRRVAPVEFAPIVSRIGGSELPNQPPESEIPRCDPAREADFVNSCTPLKECRTCIPFSSPGRQGGTRSVRPNPLIGTLRHKFVMEATEIKAPNKPWRLIQHNSTKAVLFSNPAFAPASPPGARPTPEKRAPTPPVSVSRSSSTTRRVLDRIERVIKSGRRSLSPDISRRFHRWKPASLSPRKSLPSLISRLPSKVSKPSAASAPRASVLRTSSRTKPVPFSCGELPLPPGRKAHQGATQQPVRIIDHNSIAEQLKRDFGTPPPSSKRGVVLHTTSCTKPVDLSTSSRQEAQDDSASQQSVDIIDYNSNAERSKRDFVVNTAARGPSSSPIRQLIHLDCNQVEFAPPIARKENAFHFKAASDWGENSEILNACRKWVEESSPPLPGAVGTYDYDQENDRLFSERPHKENGVPPDQVNEVGVAMNKSPRKRMAETNVVPNVVPVVQGCSAPGMLRRSWSASSRRSLSAGRIRSGSSALLRKARDWVRTQTPYRRDRPQQSMAMA